MRRSAQIDMFPKPARKRVFVHRMTISQFLAALRGYSFRS